MIQVTRRDVTVSAAGYRVTGSARAEASLQVTNPARVQLCPTPAHKLVSEAARFLICKADSDIRTKLRSSSLR
jgi:hypothetical protein